MKKITSDQAADFYVDHEYRDGDGEYVGHPRIF